MLLLLQVQVQEVPRLSDSVPSSLRARGPLRIQAFPISIYKRGLSVCLSVCLFVCSDLEPKLLDGFQPNLAWVTLRSLWVTSKYFFGLTPPGGVQFWKNSKHLTFPVWPRAGGDILLRHLLRHLLRNFLSFFWGGDLDTLLNGPSGARLVNGLASQRVRSSPQPAST